MRRFRFVLIMALATLLAGFRAGWANVYNETEKIVENYLMMIRFFKIITYINPIFSDFIGV